MAYDPFDLDIPRPPSSELRPFPESLPPPAPSRIRSREPRRGMVLAGVCGACVMGAGLGLWARPAEGERQANLQDLVRSPAAAQPLRRLQIVVDDAPAPIGAPMEVMRAVATPAPAFEPAPPIARPAEPISPTPAPAGLVRVITTPLPVETADLSPPLRKPEVRKAEPAKVEKLATTKKAEPEKAKARKTEPKKAEPKAAAKTPGAQKAKTKPAKADVRTADATKPKAKKAGVKAAEAKSTKADRRADDVKVAKAKSRAENAKLAKAERTKAEKAKAAKAETLKLAEAKAAKAKPAKAAAKPKVEKAEAAPVRKPPAPIKGEGPLRKVSNGCASADFAEALVCADPSLGAADRRLARAYRQAEAAGVSASELRRQQQRWLAARAAAAREAPWAVQDVYQARIAELEDLTRDAGY